MNEERKFQKDRGGAEGLMPLFKERKRLNESLTRNFWGKRKTNLNSILSFKFLCIFKSTLIQESFGRYFFFSSCSFHKFSSNLSNSLLHQVHVKKATGQGLTLKMSFTSAHSACSCVRAHTCMHIWRKPRSSALVQLLVFSPPLFLRWRFSVA